METFTSVDSDVNGRTNAFSVGQIELTYTALCADCSRNCDSFGVEKFERFQKAWMGPGLIKGGRCLRGPNMRASSSRSTGSVSVPNDRPPRRVATRRGSRSPQSAAPITFFDAIYRSSMLHGLNYYAAGRTRCA